MNKTIKIKVKGKDYNIKANSYRAMFLYEDMSNKKINEISTFKDQIMFLYCSFLASNEDFKYSFDEFINILEEDQNIFDEFIKMGEELNKKKT